MPIKDLFTKLNQAVIGTKTSNIDTKLDSAIKDILTYKTSQSKGSYIEIVKNLLTQSHSSTFSMDNQGLFGQGPVSPAVFGQGTRLLRYKTYESIVSNINYCFRGLSVLTDNIMSPDDITKVSIEVNPESCYEEEIETESKTKHIKDILKQLKLEQNLDIIIKNTLLFGDFFVEIGDEKTALISKAYLTEDMLINDDDDRIEKYKCKLDDKNNLSYCLDYSAFNESKKDEDKESSGKPKDVEKYKLLYHDPRRVIKLQSELFPICLGYFVFPKYSLFPSLAFQDQAINNMCLTILKSLGNTVPRSSEISKQDIKDMITMVVAGADPTKQMNIRYIPPNKMQHFFIPSLKYYPYGESIFDSCQFNAKVLIALETALAIQRLSRSTEKRKIAIEIGLHRDARKLVEKMKEEFRKRKISLDSFGSVDTIPSSITTFEDVYIPQKDGKPFVDISTFNEGNVDVRNKVDELKFIRDSVVASLGIPPSFVGIEENLSNKAALSEENILFARTIVSHQKYLTSQLRELVGKVYEVLDPDEALTALDNITIALPSPKSLQFEREARYTTELANLIETLDRIGIPKEWAKKKYLTSIDWDDLKRYEIDEKIDKTIGVKKDEEGGLGGMGMGGAY